MPFNKHIGEQLTSKTKSQFIKALKNDDYQMIEINGAQLWYKDEDSEPFTFKDKRERIGRSIIREIIRFTGWDERDLKRLKLVK